MTKKSARIKHHSRPAIVKVRKISPSTSPIAIIAALGFFAFSALFLRTQVQTYKLITGDGRTTFVVPNGNENKNPTILTYAIPRATQGTYYTASIIGSDQDAADALAMTIVGMPLGVKATSCAKKQVNGSTNGVACTIAGTPTQSGTFELSVILRDGVGHAIRNQIPLDVVK